MSTVQLRITEIFYSLQGETCTVGLPTVFVRLTGCPLRCGYCDTAYAFSGGKVLTLEEILTQVDAYEASYVTVTGGEPLAQPQVTALLKALCDRRYEVSLETSGALPVDQVDSRVVKVLDLKTPGSKESHRNLYENIGYLNQKDQVKFVICDRDDYEWAKSRILQHGLAERVQELLFSPSHGEIEARDLAQWILEDGLKVRLQLQLHKLLWDDEQGR